MSAGGKCARCGWPATRVARFTLGSRDNPATMVEELCARHATAIRKLYPRSRLKITRLVPKENAR